MQEKYTIVALYGKAGAGKDTILNYLKDNLGEGYNAHFIVSHTTRPPREGEVEGEAYYFTDIPSFTAMVLNGEMLEAQEFNNWFYGTSINALNKNKINIGVFNIAGIDALLEDPRVKVIPVKIEASDKTRLLRQLNREEHPDIHEIIRRFSTDEKDFAECDFSAADFQTTLWNDGATPVKINAWTLAEMIKAL